MVGIANIFIRFEIWPIGDSGIVFDLRTFVQEISTGYFENYLNYSKKP